MAGILRYPDRDEELPNSVDFGVSESLSGSVESGRVVQLIRGCSETDDEEDYHISRQVRTEDSSFSLRTSTIILDHHRHNVYGTFSFVGIERKI